MLIKKKDNKPEKVFIFDTTLRDGEQSPGCSMTIQEKKKMAAKLFELGVDIVEAGFPVASSGDFEAVHAICQEFSTMRVAALARSCRQDIEVAAKALEGCLHPRIHTFIATSDVHLEYKLKKSRTQVTDEAVSAVAKARNYSDDVEFSPEDGSRTDPQFLLTILTAVVDAGATTINIPDTVGYSVPTEFGGLISRVVEALGHKCQISVHCHDDLGLAVANSIAGICAGARQVECTINGIGERSGNCALEEVAMILKTREDLFHLATDIDTRHLYSASQLLSSIIGFGVQPNKAIVGANAFSHEAGIHQDGFLKERTTYEIIRPETVGVPASKIVLGKHSGRHGLRARCEELGWKLSTDQLEKLYQRFISFADRKKGVLDQEILLMIAEITGLRKEDHREHSGQPLLGATL